MGVLDAKAMSPAERVLAMEEPWASRCEQEHEVESPAWHEEVLADRRARLAAGQPLFSSLEALRERFES